MGNRKHCWECHRWNCTDMASNSDEPWGTALKNTNSSLKEGRETKDENELKSKILQITNV